MSGRKKRWGRLLVMTVTVGNVDFIFPLVELVCKGLAHPGKRRRQNKCLYGRPTGRFKDL